MDERSATDDRDPTAGAGAEPSRDLVEALLRAGSAGEALGLLRRRDPERSAGEILPWLAGCADALRREAAARTAEAESLERLHAVLAEILRRVDASAATAPGANAPSVRRANAGGEAKSAFSENDGGRA